MNKGLYSMKFFKVVMLLLVVVGALNWGLIGFFDYNLVHHLFGSLHHSIEKMIYILVGFAGLYVLVVFKKLLS
jgi:uncharacterized membrane protein YuzA (DUF378 family)